MYNEEKHFGLEEDWYVIRTAENKECKAVGWCYDLMENSLEFDDLNLIDEFKIPKDVDDNPIIPGYVFIKIKLVPSVYYLLPKVPYFGHWVGVRIKKLTKKDIKKVGPMGNNYPEPLTKEDLKRMENIIELFMTREANEEIIARSLIPGGFYKITGGAMKGGICIFKMIDPEDETKVDVDILVFGQATKAKLNIIDIGERKDYKFE